MTTSTLTDRLHSHGTTTVEQLLERKVVAGFELSDDFFDVFVDLFLIVGLAAAGFILMGVVFVVMAVWSNANSDR